MRCSVLGARYSVLGARCSVLGMKKDYILGEFLLEEHLMTELWGATEIWKYISLLLTWQ